MDFSTRLKELREEKDMTQKQLAKLLKITRQAVGNYEQGSRFPKDENLLKEIADIFDVSLDYLLGRVSIDIKPVDFIDEIILEHVKERKEPYYTDRAMILRELLISVSDLPDKSINKIIQAISILKNSF